MSSILGAKQYMNAVLEKLGVILESQENVIEQAVEAVQKTVQEGGLVYLFGTGHSHLLCEEGHYRAGGLAPVCPILSSALMLHEGAVTSTQLERTSGLGPTLLSRYQLTSQDILIIFSNSGVNAVPVETAIAAKALGLTVIAVVSVDYAAQVQPGPTGKRLMDVADIVIDNQGLPGDALVELADEGLRAGPLSTIAGAFILNAILTEVSFRMAQDKSLSPLPIYISANMPGAASHNAALVESYRTRNPHL